MQDPAPAVIHCIARSNDAASAGRVTMFNFAGIDHGDGFKSAMRMFADAAFACPRREVMGGLRSRAAGRGLAVRRESGKRTLSEPGNHRLPSAVKARCRYL